MTHTAEKGRIDRLSDLFDSPEGEVVRFTMFKQLDKLGHEPPLPFGYRIEPCTEPLWPAYAAALAVAFSDSPDLGVYPRLASKEGCLSIMKEIAGGSGFLSGASWLVLFGREPSGLVITSRSSGATSGQINIVAVTPRHRRIGVGRHLVSRALWAFHDRHIPTAAVRVNRSNRPAVQFFRSVGFQTWESRTYL